MIAKRVGELKRVAPTPRALLEGLVSALDRQGTLRALAPTGWALVADVELGVYTYSLVRWPTGPPVKVTSCEREILDGMREGKGDKQIAREMLISQHTLRSYVHRLHAKPGARSRVALAMSPMGLSLDEAEDLGGGDSPSRAKPPE